MAATVQSTVSESPTEIESIPDTESELEPASEPKPVPKGGNIPPPPGDDKESVSKDDD
jgi:hypothetical protein